MNKYEEEVAKQVQRNLGSGQILKGTQEGTVVVVGENMLAIAYVDTSENTTLEQIYIPLKEVVIVRVLSSDIIVELKSDEKQYLNLEPDADVDTMLMHLLDRIDKAKNR